MKVAIFGAGGNGRVICDFMQTTGVHEVVGFLDDDTDLHGKSVCGAPVLGGREKFESEQRKNLYDGLLVSFGDNKLRRKIANEARDCGVELTGFVHPSAIISPLATIDKTAQIWANVIVSVEASVGADTIITSGVHVEHNVSVGSNTFVAPKTVFCGFSSVGSGCWVGTGVVLFHTLSIGDNVTVGAGSIISKNLPNNVKAFGNPCRIQSES